MSSFQVTPPTHSSDLRRRWTSLKRWLTSGGAPTSAIGLSELRTRHIRLPDAAGGLSEPVARVEDEEGPLTTGCCFARSRDAARLTAESPGVAVCGGTTAMYVGTTDAISTARLLGDVGGQRTCSLTRGSPETSSGPPGNSEEHRKSFRNEQCDFGATEWQDDRRTW